MKKVILITGASKGIGKAIALELALNNYTICINYKSDKTKAKEVANEILKNGGEATIIKADISIEEEVLSLFNAIDKKYGRLDGLVNNAGILTKKSPLSQMTADRINNIFKTNVIGSFLCSREAIKRMSIKYGGNGGGIVNISSGASKSGSPNEYIDYAATKGAIDTFTVGLAKEIASEHIRVNAIRPGFIDTNIHKIPNRLETIKSTIPMERIGEPKEIANAVLWLLSNKSSYTTGAIIDVAGGK